MRRPEIQRKFQPVQRLRRILAGGQIPEEPVDSLRISAVVTRISKTPDGERFLSWLWDQTYGRTMQTDISDGALREMSGAKKLLDQILSLIEDEDAGGKHRK